jgi:hypothetical protein
MGLARPAVLAACLLIVGFDAKTTRDTVATCFPHLGVSLEPAIAPATSISELYL